MSRSGTETNNEKKEKKLIISLLSSAMWAFFILALAAGARLLYDYACGFISREGLLAGVEEVIFYVVIAIVALIILRSQRGPQSADRELTSPLRQHETSARQKI